MKRIIVNLFLILLIIVSVYACKKDADGTDQKDPDSTDNPTGKVPNSSDMLGTTPQPYSGPEIVRLAWGSIPQEFTSVARFQELKEAGITHHFHYYYSNIAEVQKVLNAAQSNGIKVIIVCPELYSDPVNSVQQFMNHPALWGYFVSDEPDGEAKIIEAGKLADRIRAADPLHPCYMNLGPGGKFNTYSGVPYEDVLLSYNKYFKPEVLSFDNYPISIQKNQTEISIRNTWFDNLEVVSSFGKSLNKPFWAFALSTPHIVSNRSYPTPTIAHLRLQVYCNLAYGAQGIQYFTYWQTASDPNSTEKYFPGPIALDGNKTAIYDLLKTVNSEIKNLSFVFAGAKVNWVRTKKISDAEQKNITPLTNELSGSPITELINSGGILISQLDKGDDRYLVIVNYQLTLNSLSINPGSQVKRVLKSGVLIAAEKEVDMLPGDVVIYTWKK